MELALESTTLRAESVLREAAVREDALDLGLRVVEVAADGAYGNVATNLRDHLEALDVRDLAPGIEDADARVGHAREAIERCLAGVA